jgi:hypothetical protein
MQRSGEGGTCQSLSVGVCQGEIQSKPLRKGITRIFPFLKRCVERTLCKVFGETPSKFHKMRVCFNSEECGIERIYFNPRRMYQTHKWEGLKRMSELNFQGLRG